MKWLTIDVNGATQDRDTLTLGQFYVERANQAATSHLLLVESLGQREYRPRGDADLSEFLFPLRGVSLPQRSL